MAISAQDVNALRQQTGAGIMDCKKALQEAHGDVQQAIAFLRKRGQKISAARADRHTGEGAVFTCISDDHSTGVLVALGCETDFVAKNEAFLALGNAIAQAALQHLPDNLDALLELTLDSQRIAEHMVELSGKVGEKISLTGYSKLAGGSLASYIHLGNTIGVLVSGNATPSSLSAAEASQALRDICMHIAAMDPIALRREDIQESQWEALRQEARMRAEEEGNLDREQHHLGQVQKERILLEQSFVKDPSLTVDSYISQKLAGLHIQGFVRLTAGA